MHLCCFDSFVFESTHSEWRQERKVLSRVKEEAAMSGSLLLSFMLLENVHKRVENVPNIWAEMKTSQFKK